MLQTIKGSYDKGKIELEEDIEIKKKVRVLVTHEKDDIMAKTAL